MPQVVVNDAGVSSSTSSSPKTLVGGYGNLFSFPGTFLDLSLVHVPEAPLCLRQQIVHHPPYQTHESLALLPFPLHLPQNKGRNSKDLRLEVRLR